MQDSAGGLPDGDATGRISLAPVPAGAESWGAKGEFKGTITPAGGAPQERTLTLGNVPRLGKPVTSDPERGIEVDVVDASKNPPQVIGRLKGSIPRSFWNRFEAPPDDIERDLDRAYLLELHRQLGKFHELALTFTMIAGLLNILVILDAVEGPAYGYGDGGKDRPPLTAGASTTGASSTGVSTTGAPTTAVPASVATAGERTVPTLPAPSGSGDKK